MRESEVEKYFVWAVISLGGRSWKFTSPNNRGVSDRIACLPDGTTWFVELKTRGGRLSELQKMFAAEMEGLGQNYRCFWNKEQIEQWRKDYELQLQHED